MEPNEYWLKNNLIESFALPEDATAWLCSLFKITQIFDDYADGDEVPRSSLNDLIWETLVSFPSNPFYVRNQSSLSPLVATYILKWQASDSLEREGKANEKSFVWRAGFYDILLFVFACCHGRAMAEENAAKVLSLYGEKYSVYKKEFKNV